MVGAGMFAMFLFLGIFMQTILGYSPVQAGFAFLPFSVGIILGSRCGLEPAAPGRAAAADDPRSARRRCGSMLWLAQLEPDSSYFTHICCRDGRHEPGHGIRLHPDRHGRTARASTTTTPVWPAR
jgi:hypothetical protein